MINTKIGRRFYILISVMVGAVLFVSIWDGMSETLDPILYFFIYSIPSNTAISLFPHEPVLVFLGASYNPILLAIVASLGTVVAGLLDYYVFVPLFAHSALNDLKTTKGYKTATRWFVFKPFFTIVLAGFTPVPFFIFKFIAFTVQYPLYRYLSAVLVGRFPRYYLLALVGEVFEIPNWIIIGIFLGMLLIYLVHGYPHIVKYMRHRKELAARKVKAKTQNCNQAF